MSLRQGRGKLRNKATSLPKLTLDAELLDASKRQRLIIAHCLDFVRPRESAIVAETVETIF